MTTMTRKTDPEAMPVPPEFVKGVSGFAANTRLGIVYGRRGNPLRNRDAKGYIRVTGNLSSEWLNYAHRIICAMQYGQIPDGMTVNHINGNKLDNRAENLEVVTQSENSLHGHRTGLINNAGERHWRAALTWDQVQEIRESSDSQRNLAAQYGVTKSTIWGIKSGRYWRKSGK